MATRRIARGRGASPVPIIILSVLLVGLLLSTIVLGMKVGDMEDLVKKRDDRIIQMDKSAKAEQDKFRQYERLVGLTYEGARGEFEGLKKELESKAPLPASAAPAGDDAVSGPFDDMKTLLEAYADRCAAVEKVVQDLEGQLAVAKDQRDEARVDVVEKAKAKDEQVKAEKVIVARLRTEKTTVQGELDKTRADLTAEVEALKAEKTKLIKQVNALTKDTKDLAHTVKKKEEVIRDLRFPKKTTGPLVPGQAAEPVDGKVLVVDPDGQHVMVDLGRNDWVEVGMMFKVFDNADPDARKEKGQVQIRAVYDEIARAKVLDPDEVDPILPGMVIVNPAFKRGRKLEFVLEGRFNEARIEQMLKRYPCTIAKAVSRKTDYVVTGEGRLAEGEAAPEDSENVMNAKDYKIPVMKERELLHYLGEDM